MTEAEWLACTDPGALLNFLKASYRYLSARKLRLFAVYCCRNVVCAEHRPETRHAVHCGEQFAEGFVTPEEFHRVDGPATLAWLEEGGDNLAEAAVVGLARYAIQAPFRAAGDTSLYAIEGAGLRAGTGSRETESVVQAAWLRDIFPSPYRPKFVSRDWFSWNDGAAVALASQMYESRDFGSMPILADALQDAGCDSADVLDHCRGPGPHVRGCWVVDLVLGKE